MPSSIKPDLKVSEINISFSKDCVSDMQCVDTMLTCGIAEGNFECMSVFSPSNVKYKSSFYFTFESEKNSLHS